MAKLKRIIWGSFLLLTLVIFLTSPNSSKLALKEVCALWLNQVVISILPIYIISSLLYNTPLLSHLIYPITYKVMHFENQKACSLFLISIITGHPTTAILISDATANQEISVNEGNRLLAISSFMNPLFVVYLWGWAMAGCFIMAELITALILGIILKGPKQKVHALSSPKISHAFNNIINNTPHILLSILMVMIMVTLLKIPLLTLLTTLNLDNMLFVQFPLDLLEVTTGMSNINEYALCSPFKAILGGILLCSGGISIILQVISVIKKTILSKTSFLKFKLLSTIIFTIIFTSLLLVFFF